MRTSGAERTSRSWVSSGERSAPATSTKATPPAPQHEQAEQPAERGRP